jgi:hypothetical protein
LKSKLYFGVYFVLQRLQISNEFFKKRFKHSLNIPESLLLKKFIATQYGSHSSFNEFYYLKEKTFTSFFRESNVDVPICFKKTMAVRRLTNEIKLLKFNNYFMHKGKKLQSLKTINYVFQNQYLNSVSSDLRIIKSNYSWKTVFLILNNLNYNNYLVWKIPFIKNEETTHNHYISSYIKRITPTWDFNVWLFKNLNKLLPIFSFYIYKVDKKIFKNTRGKSGKFTFIWKYIPSYKRAFLIMHWLMRELKLTSGKKLKIRMLNLIHSVVYKPKATWIYKVKKFSHNYVYKNAKNTLAETYKTVTK